MTTIYIHTSETSGKSYIGLSKRPNKRFSRHYNDSLNGSKTHFHQAISKYGKEDFVYQEIEKIEDELAYDREVFYIKLFNTYNEGYNSTHGGEGAKGHSPWNKGMTGIVIPDKVRRKMSSTHTGMKRSKEQCESISKSLMGREISKEWRKKISESRKGMTGEQAGFYGKKHTEEHKAKMRIPKPKFECDNCGKIVGGKSNLIQHKRKCEGDN